MRTIGLFLPIVFGIQLGTAFSASIERRAGTADGVDRVVFSYYGHPITVRDLTGRSDTEIRSVLRESLKYWKPGAVVSTFYLHWMPVEETPPPKTETDYGEILLKRCIDRLILQFLAGGY